MSDAVERNTLGQVLWDATRAQDWEDFMPTVMTDMGSCLRAADAILAAGFRLTAPRDGVVRRIKGEALREAAADFRAAASSGIEPDLNLTAARLLTRRAERIEARATNREVGS